MLEIKYFLNYYISQGFEGIRQWLINVSSKNDIPNEELLKAFITLGVCIFLRQMFLFPEK